MKKKILKTETVLRDVDPLSEASLIDLAHELAMSEEPSTAATGRLLKAIIPGWNQFMHDEIRNSRNPNHDINAMLGSFGLLTGMCVGLTRDGEENLQKEDFIARLAEGFKECLPNVKKVSSSKKEHNPVVGDGFVMINSEEIEC